MYVFPFYAALAASGGLPVLPLVIAILAIVCVVLFFVLKGRGTGAPAGKTGEVGEASADVDLSAMAAELLAAVGGRENVTGVDCCASRVRFEVRDFTAINEKALKAAGAAGVTRPSKTSCHVLLGSQAQALCGELNKLL